jgi:hypothetical protein
MFASHTLHHYFLSVMALSNNSVYHEIAENAVEAPTSDDRLTLLREGLQGAGTHVFLGYYLTPEEFKLEKYWMSKEGLEGTNPYGGYIMNKKWHLAEQFQKHILLFHQV